VRFIDDTKTIQRKQIEASSSELYDTMVKGDDVEVAYYDDAWRLV
jgi:hypothetical protein